MYTGFILAGRAMKAAQYAVDVLSNNIANANTAGYKRDYPVTRFTDELESARAYETDMSQGPIVPTGEPLDLALDGEAMFVVSTPGGLRYTRDGRFRVAGTGGELRLVTAQGYAVMGEGGPLSLTGSGGPVEVDASGRLRQGGTEAGRLRIVWPGDPGALAKEGAGLFRAEAAPPPARDFSVRQGFIEKSNVRTVEEMGALLAASRGHEATARSLRVINRTLQKLLSVVRGRV